MKKLLVLALLALSTVTFAETSTIRCKGVLLGQKTKAFGSEKYTIDVNWKIVTEDHKITLSENQLKMTGTVKDGFATLESEERSEKMTLSQIDDTHIEVKGKTFNSGNLLVSNITGILTCK